MKFILNCEPEDIILAARAAKFLYRAPEKSDAIVEFSGDPPDVFIAVRRKASISVTKAPATAGEPKGPEAT